MNHRPAATTDPQATAEAPFAGLMPDVALDALAAVGFEGDGRITQLNSFENRVLQVMQPDGTALVTKFYRPSRWTDQQIGEEHGFSLEAAQDEVPVVAPLALQAPPADGPVSLSESAPRTLARYQGAGGSWRFAIWPRRAGRPPELEDAAVLLRLGSCLARLHRVGERQAFRHRRSIDILADARAAVERLQRDEALPPDQAAPWSQACVLALTYIENATRSARPTAIRLHGDCHPGNLLWRDDRPILVDLDDACNGPAVQDLWMLLSGDPEAAREQLRILIEGYEQVRPFDRRELRLIDALRLGRMLHHNAWVSQRWGDPAFPIAYPDFGSSSYWAQQAMQLREQVAQAA